MSTRGDYPTLFERLMRKNIALKTLIIMAIVAIIVSIAANYFFYFVLLKSIIK